MIFDGFLILNPRIDIVSVVFVVPRQILYIHNAHILTFSIFLMFISATQTKLWMWIHDNAVSEIL